MIVFAMMIEYMSTKMIKNVAEMYIVMEKMARKNDMTFR